MSEGNKNYNDDDLSAFADYLAEFESIINFDDETCPVCGINISETISIQQSPFVKYKSLSEESELISLTRELDLKCIPYKIEKQLNPKSVDEIHYNYNVLVPFRCLDSIKK